MRTQTKGDGLSLIILAGGMARRYGGVKPLAPVGADGEAVIDLVAADAIAGGFERLVLVVNPQSGEEIRAHVAQCWPREWDVSFCVQVRSEGTAAAVATGLDGVRGPFFGVANGDDIYGKEAMARLTEHLRERGTECLVGYSLANTVIGDDAVSRGVCRVEKGELRAITERSSVRRAGSGFSCGDDKVPLVLDGDTVVSMNLWGLSVAMGERVRATVRAHNCEEGEARLPDVVEAALVEGVVFRVLMSEGLCIGVTHYSDLVIAQELVAGEVASGRREAGRFTKGVTD